MCVLVHRGNDYDGNTEVLPSGRMLGILDTVEGGVGISGAFSGPVFSPFS